MKLKRSPMPCGIKVFHHPPVQCFGENYCSLASRGSAAGRSKMLCIRVSLTVIAQLLISKACGDFVNDRRLLQEYSSKLVALLISYHIEMFSVSSCSSSFF